MCDHTQKLLPFTEDIHCLTQYCKLPLHIGVAEIQQHGDPNDPWTKLVEKFNRSRSAVVNESGQHRFSARFFVPAAGNCRIFLELPAQHRLSKNFGEGLVVEGESGEGRFRMSCPRYYIKAVSAQGEQPGWAVATSVNEPVIISYGMPRPIFSVTATINNFDFDFGNVQNSDGTGRGSILRVDANGRTVDFVWRQNRNRLRQLVDAGLLGTTSFVTFSFNAWPEASEAELIEFSHNISTFLFYIAEQHTVASVLSFYDQDGGLVKRIIGNAIQSKVRDISTVRVLHLDDGLPRLFRECFAEHCRMRRSNFWFQMPAMVASIEDSVYLEQKFSTLMAGVELLIRNSIVEARHLTLEQAESKFLPDLIAMARGTLHWDVPKHYTAKERYRKTRNAVNHGSSLPYANAKVRADFDKWKLFLIRRLFIRLGFTGEVQSPRRGWASSSPVGEFSEEHNSFD